VPPKYFYDELGSALFDAICALPEYYVTRAEAEIFRTQGAKIAAEFGAPVRLIELGCGNARKTRILFDAILAEQPSLDYVGVDIDPTVVASLQRDLSLGYPAVRMTPVAHDFRDIRQILAPIVPRGGGVRNVVLFIGSTIGNLPPSEADEMLSAIRGLLDPGDALFLGTDLIKPKGILEEAYDDPTGVTAAFNLNMLGRMNRELCADFNLRAFRHRAFYNDVESRIEMHVVSEIAQSVHIGAIDLRIDFSLGETIHTESSYKFDDASIASLAARAGFRVQQRWLDSRRWFADTMLAAV
jgi:dimethylhistidine N-methyltransferase